jgi:hypothetical protein
MHERLHHVVLANQPGKIRRTQFTSKYLVGHIFDIVGVTPDSVTDCYVSVQS